MCRSTVTNYIYSCSILSAEFLRASIHDAGGSDVVILSQVKARASVPINGKDDDVSLVAYLFIFFLPLKLNVLVPLFSMLNESCIHARDCNFLHWIAFLLMRGNMS